MIDIQRPPKDPDSVSRTFLEQFVLVPLVSLIIARNTSRTNNTRTNTSWPVKVPLTQITTWTMKMHTGQWKCYTYPAANTTSPECSSCDQLMRNRLDLAPTLQFQPAVQDCSLSNLATMHSQSILCSVPLTPFFLPCNSALSFSSSSTL